MRITTEDVSNRCSLMFPPTRPRRTWTPEHKFLELKYPKQEGITTRDSKEKTSSILHINQCMSQSRKINNSWTLQGDSRILSSMQSWWEEANYTLWVWMFNTSLASDTISRKDMQLRAGSKIKVNTHHIRNEKLRIKMPLANCNWCL